MDDRQRQQDSFEGECTEEERALIRDTLANPQKTVVIEIPPRTRIIGISAIIAGLIFLALGSALKKASESAFRRDEIEFAASMERIRMQSDVIETGLDEQLMRLEEAGAILDAVEKKLNEEKKSGNQKEEELAQKNPSSVH